MIVDVPTPCFQKSDLFDSTELEDHIAARALCSGCDYRPECRAEARAAKDALGGSQAVDGTWGGQLWRGGKISLAVERERKRAEENAAYTLEEATRCSSLYACGDRSDYVKVGRRVYDRARYATRKDGAA